MNMTIGTINHLTPEILEHIDLEGYDTSPGKFIALTFQNKDAPPMWCILEIQSPTKPGHLAIKVHSLFGFFETESLH